MTDKNEEKVVIFEDKCSMLPSPFYDHWDNLTEKEQDMYSKKSTVLCNRGISKEDQLDFLRRLPLPLETIAELKKEIYKK
jgi:hypothetical protein